jgi:hypothetical protein
MNFVYFSHSYREEDTSIVAFFGRLMRSEGFIPSLDPPSESVNAAKLERHLRSCDGMVAILTRREGGVSPHILFEISLALIARKPLLVFIEDTVRTAGLIADRILQSRFSRRSYFRQVRDHRNVLRILKSYLGENPPPRYQPLRSPRFCVLVGSDSLQEALRDCLAETITSLDYDLRPFSLSERSLSNRMEVSEVLSGADLAVSVIDYLEVADQYLMGALRASFIPSITLSTDLEYEFSPSIPEEYQPRVVDGGDLDRLRDTLKAEIELYEEEFLEVEKSEELDTYVSLLVEYASPGGSYESGVHNLFIREMSMSQDEYKIEQSQVGAVGHGAHAHDMTFNQVWDKSSDQIGDLSRLADELEQLRAALRQQAQTVEEDSAVAAVAQAEVAAKEGQGPTTLEHLSKAGVWALDMAKTIGATVAAAAIRAALGLP